MKIFVCFLLFLFSCSVIVSAFPYDAEIRLLRSDCSHYNSDFNFVFYCTRCEFVRPATLFRPMKSFGFIGIWGRLSDGNFTCFVPGRSSHNVVATPKPVSLDPVCHDETMTREVCDDTEVCNEVCHKEKTWKYTCWWQCPPGKIVCNHGWVWEPVCYDDCHVEHSCHDEDYVVNVCV